MRRLAVFTFVFGLLAWGGVDRAQAQRGSPATLEEIQKKLDDMDQKLNSLLEGQKASVEEHQQIRAWCRR